MLIHDKKHLQTQAVLKQSGHFLSGKGDVPHSHVVVHKQFITLANVAHNDAMTPLTVLPQIHLPT